ncbi:MAG: DUF481 domain-containing protein [Thalassolituus sp.]|jgi:putative salt-induced outer membrane protein YdiY|uniref:Salt-induced outer membrane protein n=2 Tax=root TaxID=1 RepID=M5E794_9GAMM|nr:DUF481 domain-containing protein [Thalassolituus oleivorans]PHQ86205.1 MAG: DUF481 domain-containing protein [Thalassobium sp.]AHK17299.1 hypothetical protein R615_03035 [Thalassolituus oleivorans R6-15]APR66128.1 hypothetical protein CN03_03795 [Thalassolituus oleivorans]MBQ0727176.1 DUF481 domain-containing protein [Thalassolituus oleivorans]MBQ0779988.1 DUF481 domain-containing protein [Thalassolituus oleivorans]|tara:strand:- start:971 stop:1714 length:744 start_codon:yes stop_codon:yes gene_type:complete
MRYALAALILAIPTAHAITDIEEKRRNGESQGWQNKIEAGFDMESGNNEKRAGSVALNSSWQGQEYRFFSWASRDYESFNGDRTDDNTFAHARMVRNFRERWAQEAFLQYERDPFASLQHRYLAGGGVRFQHKFNDKGLINQGLGLFHEQVEETGTDGTATHELTRVNLYTHFEWAFSHSHFQTTVYVQPSVDDVDDVRSLVRATLTMPVSQQVDFKWQWQSRWDTMPPEGSEYHNHQTQLKLSVRF